MYRERASSGCSPKAHQPRRSEDPDAPKWSPESACCSSTPDHPSFATPPRVAPGRRRRPRSRGLPEAPARASPLPGGRSENPKTARELHPQTWTRCASWSHSTRPRDTRLLHTPVQHSRASGTRCDRGCDLSVAAKQKQSEDEITEQKRDREHTFAMIKL